MDTQTLLNEALRAQIYKVLAECYYSPDDALLVALRDLSQSPSPLICQMADVASEVAELELLRVDHAKLFVGPYKLLTPPYGSIYLEDGKLMGQSTMQVKNLYAEEGLEFVLKEAPDHVTVELEFMHFLINKTIETQDKSDHGEELCYQQKQYSFLAGHLGQWLSRFAAKVEEVAQTDFYRTLGNVTRRFGEDELTELWRVGRELG